MTDTNTIATPPVSQDEVSTLRNLIRGAQAICRQECEACAYHGTNSTTCKHCATGRVNRLLNGGSDE